VCDEYLFAEQVLLTNKPNFILVLFKPMQ